MQEKPRRSDAASSDFRQPEDAVIWDTFTYYAVLALESVVGAFGVRLYEEPRYRVADRIGQTIEVREYAPRVAAEVTIAGTGEKARSDAFSALFNYIAGANDGASGGKKIAMTVPVAVAEPQRIAMTAPVGMSEAGGSVRMQFFLPASFSVETAPRPRDPRVKITPVPGETLAVLRFSGSGAAFPERQQELVSALAGSKWKVAGEPVALSYDAPFTLPFLKRNEAAVAVSAAGG